VLRERGRPYLPGLIGVKIRSRVCVHPSDCFGCCEVFDDYAAIIDDRLDDIVYV
jgi:hypothetical protein